MDTSYTSVHSPAMYSVFRNWSCMAFTAHCGCCCPFSNFVCMSICSLVPRLTLVFWEQRYWPIAGWNKQHCLLLPQKWNIKPTKSTSLDASLAHYQVLPLLYCKIRKLYGTFVMRFKDYHTPFLVHVKYYGAKSSVDSGALWPHSLVKCHTAACKPWWEVFFPIIFAPLFWHHRCAVSLFCTC